MNIITDHKPPVAIFKKDIATFSQRIQWILLRIHQYRVRIISKPGWDLFITDWLSRHNHTENKDPEIPGMQLNIDAIQTIKNTPDSITVQQLQQATSQDEHPTTVKRNTSSGLAREQIPDTTRHTNILDISRWHGSDWWGHTKRQAWSYTWVTQKQA